MKSLNLNKQFYLLLFSLAFITSCYAQDNTSLQKDSTFESKTHPKIVKTQATGAHVNVHCSMQDKSGNLWFGTGGEGVYRYDGKSFTNYTTKDGLNSNIISCMIEGKAGNMLFGTGRGICRYDGKSFIDITQYTVLSGSSIFPISISSMLEDKTGRLWIGAMKSGIYHYNPSAEQTDGKIFTNFLSNDSVKNDNGLSLKWIDGILEDRTGNIWFASWHTEGLSYYDGKTLTKLVEKEGLLPEVWRNNIKHNVKLNIRSILEDKNGKLWLGTQHNGVFSYDPVKDETDGKLLPTVPASFINVTQNTGISQACVMSILEDKNGDLWFCTDGGGVWRYDGTSFKNFNTEDGLLNNSVFSVVEDNEGNLWFGTRDVGLYRFDGKAFVNFSE